MIRNLDDALRSMVEVREALEILRLALERLLGEID